MAKRVDPPEVLVCGVCGVQAAVQYTMDNSPEGMAWAGECPKCKTLVVSLLGSPAFLDVMQQVFRDFAGSEPESVEKFVEEGGRWKRR